MNNYRITIKGRDDSLTLAPYSACRVVSGGISGFDFPHTETRVVSNAFGDGCYTVGGIIGARVMQVTFEIADKSRYSALRDIIVAIMNPHGKVSLDVNLYGRVRSIDARPAEMPVFDMPHMGAPATVRLTFVSEQPFFTERRINLVLPQTVPVLSFPTSLMKSAGTVCSFVTGKYFARINNPGDVDCGFVANLRAVYGDVENPTLSLDGKYIKLTETVSRGDYITFDTRPGKRRIAVNGVTRYTFDLNSSFFSLPAGVSTVSISADSGGRNMTSELEFEPLYLGA